MVLEVEVVEEAVLVVLVLMVVTKLVAQAVNPSLLQLLVLKID